MTPLAFPFYSQMKGSSMFDIYFSDLTPEAQKRFLAFYGLINAAEGNYDVFPIISIPDTDMGREGA